MAKTEWWLVGHNYPHPYCVLCAGGVLHQLPAQITFATVRRSPRFMGSKGSDNYRMDIRLGSVNIAGRFQIVVSGNQVIEVSEYSVFSPQLTPTPWSPQDAIPVGDNTWFSRLLFPTYHDFTMDNLFENVAREVEFAPSPPIAALCSHITPVSSNLKMSLLTSKWVTSSI